MNIQTLHIGMSVRHPQYGLGTVKTISESTADILFADGKHTVAPDAAGLEAAEPQAAVSGLSLPLTQFIEQTVAAAIDQLGVLATTQRNDEIPNDFDQEIVMSARIR